MTCLFLFVNRNIDENNQNELKRAKNRLAKLQREKLALEKMKQRKQEEAKKLKEAQIKKEMKNRNKIDKILSNEDANAPLIKKEQLGTIHKLR